MSLHISDELLSAHVDGALEQSELASVTAHLPGCEACALRLRFLVATRGAVAALPGEEPGPIDFSFLPPARTKLVALPARNRWQAPRWVAPLVAAAAVLLLAGGIGMVGLRHGGGAASTGSALGLPRTVQDAGPPAARSGAGSESYGAAAPGPVVGTAPSLNGGRAPTVGRSAQFPSRGGATVGVSSATPENGQRQVSMHVFSGDTALDTRGLQVTESHGGHTSLLVSSGPQLIPAGGKATGLTGTWTPAPGDYVLTAHVLLADGTELTVSLPVHVS